MGKRDTYIEQLKPISNDITRINELENMLVSNSNLPGRRANLELADAFSDCFEKIEINNVYYNLFKKWVKISEQEAPADDPKEFLPFCAVQAMGALYSGCDKKRKEEIVCILKDKANDSRWRVKEAVAMGFQRIAEKDFKVVSEIFSDWNKEGTFTEKRAIIAALAHPPVLDSRDNVLFCLNITQEILESIMNLDKDIRKSEGYKVLKKGLDYAISVFVEKLPVEGFALLKKWAEVDDVQIKRIIKSNLGKTRLTKKYGDKVNEVMEIL